MIYFIVPRLPLALFQAIFLWIAFVTLSPTKAANTATPEPTLTIDAPTIHSLGFAWNISGDDNRDASVAIQYRKLGDSTWKPAMNLFRPESKSYNWPDPVDQSVGKLYSVGNLFAGSIFDLDPDTSYEIQFSLHDPDGGDTQQTLTAKTRKIPAASNSARIRYVVPGKSGGTGSSEDPFQGLSSAIASAVKGDVFILKSGTYTGAFQFSVNGTSDEPIVIRGEDRDRVIFDASENGNTWTFDLSNREYIFLENLTLVHAKRSVRASASKGIVIRNTVMKDFPLGVGASSGVTSDRSLGPLFDDNAKDAYICDNEFLGPEPDLERLRSGSGKGSGYAPDYGIELSGTGNVICHNLLTHWWDGITSSDTCYSDKKCGSNDIYNNIFLYCTDDAMELDGSERNVRAFRNRVASNYNGMSVQPAFGGPIYIVRNELFSSQQGAFKFNPAFGNQDGPSGIVGLHNSVANYDRSIRSGIWDNLFFRNNIFYATISHSVNSDVMNTTGKGFDFDYNLFRPGSNGYPFKLTFLGSSTTVSYTTVGATSQVCTEVGNECNGSIFSSRDSEWANVPEPAIGAGANTVAFNLSDWDFSLKDGASAIDSGVTIPNVNDDFLGNAPDLGALEKGSPIPIYGRRTTPDGTVTDHYTGSSLFSGSSGGCGGCGATSAGGAFGALLLLFTMISIRQTYKKDLFVKKNLD